MGGNPAVAMNEIEHGEDWRSKVGGSPGQLSDDLTRAREPGRGRDANTPRDIPARGWNDILWRVFWSVSEDRVLSTSGGVAFFALLAIFPAIATMVSLYGLIANSGTIRGHLSLLAGILPGGVLELLGHQSLISTQDTDMFSLHSWWDLVALFSANSGVAALFDALNVVYGEKEKRSLLRFYSTTFLFTLGMIGLVIAATLAVVVAPVVLTLIGSVTPAEQLLAVLRWPALLVIVGGWLAMIYRYGPSRNDAKWRWVTAGSVTAACFGLARRCCSRGMSQTSTATTKPMVHLVLGPASWSGSGSRWSLSCLGPSSMPRWSTRPSRTAQRALPSRSGTGALTWRITSVNRTPDVHPKVRLESGGLRLPS